MFQTDFRKEEFIARRTRVANTIGEGAVAVIQGGPKEPSHDLFRQTNDFYYLCGVEVPHAYLVIQGGAGSSTLFLPHQPDERAEAEGEILSPASAEAACTLTGLDQVSGIEMLVYTLGNSLNIHIPMREAEGARMSWDTLRRAHQEAMADPWDGQPERGRAFISLIRSHFSRAEIHDLAPVIDSLRLIKSDAEGDFSRMAGRLTALAVVEAMRSTRPGVMEYQLEAAMRYVYLVNGSRDAGYRAIIASGENTWYGHYVANDQPLTDGDLVLADCAPDYHYYTSDIGRMWPVNGRYSDIQRELYGFIVEYHKVLLDVIRPGVHPDEIAAQAASRMTTVVDNTEWSKPAYEASARRSLEKMHLTHPVGMAVHDVGHYTDKPLRPGLIITLDPMMWVPEARRYIRVEDTLLITEDGYENLPAEAPLDLDDVEAVIGTGGMVQSHPAIL